jgi:hypothetical protein
MPSWRAEGHYCTKVVGILLHLSAKVLMICFRHFTWPILVDLFAILRDSLSLIFSPFYVTHSRWFVRNYTWLILVDLFAVIRDSFSLICSQLHVTQFPLCLLIHNANLVAAFTCTQTERHASIYFIKKSSKKVFCLNEFCVLYPHGRDVYGYIAIVRSAVLLLYCI